MIEIMRMRSAINVHHDTVTLIWQQSSPDMMYSKTKSVVESEALNSFAAFNYKGRVVDLMSYSSWGMGK